MRKPLFAAACAAAVAAHLGLGLWAARAQSATFDEPALLASGISFWKTGDFRMAPSDPPLGLLWLGLSGAFSRLSLPLDGPEWKGAYYYAFADHLLFWSGNDAGALLLRARVLNLLLSAVFALLLALWCRRRWGDGPALCALVLYAASPTVLAHASLATLDLPAAAAASLSALALADFLEAPRARAACAFALAGVAACLCKYSALALSPAAAAAAALSAAPRERGRAAREALRGAGPVVAAAALAALAVPRLRVGLLTRLGQAAAGRHPTFLMGRVGAEGWRWYYVVALAVKSTLPELLAAAGALALLAAGRKRRLSPATAAPLALAAAYFAAASLSRKQVGVRYALAVYPMLAALAAPSAAALLRRRRGALLLGCLAAWQAACALGTGPDWLSYFNEAAGGPDRGSAWLSDSNLDWGQDLGRLAGWVHAHGDPAVVLGYWGQDAPERFGLRPQWLRSEHPIGRRLMDPESPAREVLALSVTHLQGAYWKPPAIPAWLRRAEPLARAGRTIYVYDITDAPAAHAWLASVYEADGDAALAAHERRRAGFDPASGLSKIGR